MGDSTGTKSNVVTLAEEMQEPDPKDLVFINVCRQSSPGQDSVDDQEKDNNNDLKWMGASPCPETFIVKLTQSTSGGKDRKDFERIKHLVEVGVDGVRANAIICRDYDRLCGRNEDGEYDKFGKSLESYIRENGLHLYEQRHWFNLNNIKHEIELTGKKADSKIEGKRIELRTNRGKFKNVQAGAPQSNPPFLWDFIIDKKGRGEQSVILGVYYYLIEDKVKLFIEVVNRYLTKKYSFKSLAKELTDQGYHYYDRKDTLKVRKHKITEAKVQSLINNKTFYTGLWTQKPIRHKERGTTIQLRDYPLPMIYNGERLPYDENTYEEVQPVKEGNEKKGDGEQGKSLLKGILRCSHCGKVLTLVHHSQQNKVNRRKYKYFAYVCQRNRGGCGLRVPQKPIEQSVIAMHEHLLKDPSCFLQATDSGKDKKWFDEEISKKEKAIRNMKSESKEIYEKFKKASGKMLDDLNIEYNAKGEAIKAAEIEIVQLRQDKRDISTKQAALTRLTSIINMLMEAGFDGMSFEQKRVFLLSLYLSRNKEYNIRIWRLSETEYRWEARGRFSDRVIEGVFQSADGKGKPVETTIQCIVDRPITEDEKKLLDKHGLTDKTLWYDSDIKKVRKLLNLCVQNGTFQKHSLYGMVIKIDIPLQQGDLCKEYISISS